MVILYILIGLLVGGLGIYLLLRPRLQIVAKTNIAIEEKNQQLEAENTKLVEIKKEREQVLQLVQQEYSEMNAKRQELIQTLHDLKDTQEKAAQDFYSQALNVAEHSFQNEIDKISDTLIEKREEANQFYLEFQEETIQEYLTAIEEKQKEFSYLNDQIVSLQNDVQIALDAAKRKQEIEEKQDYYRIQLSEEDIAEISRLREVLPYLRDKTPLNKVIYKVYYERPLTDMIGRVVGPGVHTGIYKITNMKNQMCYIGQASSFADRWKQHVKRGVGAEDWTQNKLYPAMYSLGVENFTFEIIEECEREKLNEREKYWTQYFHAQDFGYSIRSG